MKKFFLLVTCSFVLIFSFSANASAFPINDYTIAFSELDSNISDLTLIDTMAFTEGRSLTILTDKNSDNVVSVGDTFVDYIALHIKSFSDINGTDVTPNYYNDDVQLTILAQVSGSIVSQSADEFEFVFNSFNISSTSDYIEMYMDTNDLNSTTTLTNANFTNLNTFSDGSLVIEADIPSTGLGVNDGDYDYDGGDGRVDLQLIEIFYASGVNDFLLSAEPNAQDLFDIYPAVYWDIDSNNDSDVTITTGVIDAFKTYFGITDEELNKLTETDSNGLAWAIFTGNDGSINTSAVPEPATIFLLGTGMLCLAGLGRKKIVG